MTSFFLECGPDLENFWKNYFDLNTDYEKMIASITPDDHYLKAASKAGQGIRILRQDTWEMIITFVISQQRRSLRSGRGGSPLQPVWDKD